MKNSIKSFTLVVRPDDKSRQIADNIRNVNSNLLNSLTESDDGDLVIAIGGDGTFIDAVTRMNFSKKKVFTGVHTGTLGFMQDLSPKDIFSIMRYFHYEENITVRKVYIALVNVHLKNKSVLSCYSLNEVQVAGANYSKISFDEYINGELLQRVSGNGIIIATSTGDTAYSLNANGAIDFSNNFQLVCTLDTPIRNAVFERFITNSIICSRINIILKPADNIVINIDGKKKDIDSKMIERVEVTMIDDSNYINKFDPNNFSKIQTIREKILGYK